jgi:putative endonuclease
MKWPFRKNIKDTGKAGEAAAVEYLKKDGYSILEQNYQNLSGRRLGEIDIIAQEKKEVVFVEVKTRNLESYGFSQPEENITRSKLFKLNRIAEYYMKSKKLFNTPYRFDAVSVWLDKDQKKAKIKHIKSIFI